MLESNEARGEDLRDLIMRPIDTDAIQAEIEQLETDHCQLDELDAKETALEAADRIATLVESVTDHVDYLVDTLLPEDAMGIINV